LAVIAGVSDAGLTAAAGARRLRGERLRGERRSSGLHRDRPGARGRAHPPAL